MIKIIHTADWHLGQTFYGYDREKEHDAFLLWLSDILIEKEIDVLLIAGDVFDVANPSASAQRRFFRFLRHTVNRNPRLQIIIIAGNHDSAARLEAPAPLLEEMNTHIVGNVKRTGEGEIDFDSLLFPLYDKGGDQAAWCMTVPFLRQGDYPPRQEKERDTYIAGIERMYKQLTAYAMTKKKAGQALIATGHLHVSGAELSENDRSERVITGGLESVSPAVFGEEIVYTALGHIHKAQRVGGADNIRYSGSPLPMSFSETFYRHQVVCVELAGARLSKIEPLPIPRTVELLRVPSKPGAPAEVIESLQSLPEAYEGDRPAPFLEVCVLLEEPAPSFRHEVEEVLKNKHVRLTSIVPSYPKENPMNRQQALSFDDLQKIEPLDMLKHVFAGKYQNEMPGELQQLFRQVMEELNMQT